MGGTFAAPYYVGGTMSTCTYHSGGAGVSPDQGEYEGRGAGAGGWAVRDAAGSDLDGGPERECLRTAGVLALDSTTRTRD